jgi:hypothetical protein
MINIGGFSSCVCVSVGNPHPLCDGELALEENGRKVRLIPKRGEEAKVVVMDGCACHQGVGPRCDGLFLLKARAKRWMISVELKGTNFDDAFEQLAETRTSRPEYQSIKSLFQAQGKGLLLESAFIVSNKMLGLLEKSRLENQFKIRVRSILFSEATSPVPDLRKEI